jgi:membrane-associated phospholipid phosphatase
MNCVSVGAATSFSRIAGEIGMQGLAMRMIAVVALLSAAPADASNKMWADASTVGRDALVAAAIGAPAVQGDWKGALQAGGSMAAADLLTVGLKEAFPEWRPDHSDRKSFPSGHTSVSFAAAATLQNRYGWEAGLPAQLVAAFVGVARVKADKHHWYDVAVGAGTGEVSGFLMTTQRNNGVHVFPWGDARNVGLTLATQF